VPALLERLEAGSVSHTTALADRVHRLGLVGRLMEAVGIWRYIGRAGEPQFENGWDNCSSDPIKDIEEVLARGFEEGWKRDVPMR
jgi:hypothetical protein